MKPDEMLRRLERIRGLGEFPIENHEHLIRLLGGADKVLTFGGRKIGAEDVLRMYPVNYFPIAPMEDLAAKASKLMELGRRGFHPAAGSCPEGDPPKSIKRYKAAAALGADGLKKVDRHST